MLEALFYGVHEEAQQRYHAFFSSEIGGITTEPALMMIHMVSLLMSLNAV